LIVYELTSPLKNSKTKVYVAEDLQDEEDLAKTKLEIEKLKLENEQLKIKQEIKEKENKRITCEHCGASVSTKDSVCPNCKAPIKIK